MTIDPRAFRNALGCFATGIAVVTTLCPDRRDVGVTVNSFSSVSLDPPLILFSLARTSQAYDFFVNGPAFAVNVLASDQEDLSSRFSRRDLPDRWEGVGADRWDSGVPILAGCLANLECDREAVHDGGDHAIIIGRVRRLHSAAAGQPLLYFRGGYARLA